MQLSFGKIALVLFGGGTVLAFIDTPDHIDSFVHGLSNLFIRLGLLAAVLWAVALLLRRINIETLLGNISGKNFNSRAPSSIPKRPLIFLLLIILLLIPSVVLYQRGKRLEQKLSEVEQRFGPIEQKLGGVSRLACTETAAVEKVRPSVVRIVGGESEGSGFSASGDYILTNFHVIEFEPSPKVIFPDNSFENATIVMADKDADIALLKVEKALAPIEWRGPEPLEAGEPLLAVGFPLGGTLPGESSVTRGIFSGRRHDKTTNVDYFQIDGTLNPGMSGGPMVDICGRMVGMSSAGISGLGLAISAQTISGSWSTNETEPEKIEGITKLSFEPERGPVEAVRAFYNYLKVRNLEKAYALLDEHYPHGDGGFEEWKQGYATMLDTSAIKLEPVQGKENIVFVKLAAKDLVDDEIVYSYFEGTIEARQIEGEWHLWDASIKRVENPDYAWLYE